MDELNPKQRRFVSEYLKDENGKKAAIRAGYSPKTAEVQAAQLLRKLKVKQAVDAALTKIHEKASLTKERILQALLNVAELDPRKLFTESGRLKPIAALPADVALALASIEVEESESGWVRKVKLCDKVKALELLGKHLKLFDDMSQLAGAPMVINIVPANNSDKRNKGD